MTIRELETETGFFVCLFVLKSDFRIKGQEISAASIKTIRAELWKEINGLIA